MKTLTAKSRILFVSASLFLISYARAEIPFTALPQPFETRNGPVAWAAKSSDALTIIAGAKTNWFVSPWDSSAVDNAPMLLIPAKGDFSLSAKIALRPKTRWDSGALVLFIDKDNWAKLCLENSVNDGKLSVVSVVNRGISDDNYSVFTAADNSLFLKVSRQGPAYMFFASQDGESWTMLRDFTMGGDSARLRTGLLAQSPTGDGMTVDFTAIRYDSKP